MSGKLIYITFSGMPYDTTTQKIYQRAKPCGADECRVYDDHWLIHTEFYQHNKWLWDHPHKRGFGWYCWKPYIILDALSKSDNGDVVLYTDADTYPIANLRVIFDTASRDGVMLFAAGHFSNRQWCKADCFTVMGQDEKKYIDCQAGVARFMAFQNGPWRPRQFLMEWLTYCVNPFATTFDISHYSEENPGFIEHRTEQAIMTLLAHKYGYKLHREADQHGMGFPEDKDLYGQLFCQEPVKDYLNVTAPVHGSQFRNV